MGRARNIVSQKTYECSANFAKEYFEIYKFSRSRFIVMQRLTPAGVFTSSFSTR